MTDDYYLNLRCHSCFAFAFIAATTTLSSANAISFVYCMEKGMHFSYIQYRMGE